MTIPVGHSINVAAVEKTPPGDQFDVSIVLLNNGLPFSSIPNGWRPTIHVSCSDTEALLPDDYTFVDGDIGNHSLPLTLNTLGLQVITVRADDGTTGTRTINVNDLYTIDITGEFNPVAGTPYTYTFTLKKNGATATSGWLPTISFTSTDMGATLPMNYTFLSGDHGVKTRSITFAAVAGTPIQITATDVNNTDRRGFLNVGALFTLYGTPTRVALVGRNQGYTIGAYISGDPQREPYQWYPTVTVTSSDEAATLPAPYEYVFNDVNLGHVFGVTLNTAGSKTLTFTSLNNYGQTVTLVIGVTVVAAATQVSVSALSPDKDTDFRVLITLTDGSGNIDFTNNGFVTITKTSPNAADRINGLGFPQTITMQNGQGMVTVRTHNACVFTFASAGLTSATFTQS